MHSPTVDMSALNSELGSLPVSESRKYRVTIRLCGTLAELEELRPAWNHLLQTCPRASIFLTPEWLFSWWQAFGAARQLLTIAFHDGDQKVVGLAPMYVEQQKFCGLHLNFLRLLGAGSGDSDALDFLISPGYEQACAEAFLAWLAQESASDVCALETLPQDSAIAQYLSTITPRSGIRLYSENLPNVFIDLPATWPGYLQTLAPAFRPLLTRYPRRLQSRFQVEVTRCGREGELASSLDALFTLHQMRWTGRGEPGAFSNPERRDFYLRMAHAFQSRGWLEFWLLRLDGEVAAAQFCFRYRDTVYLLQEGFHPKYAAEKVGYALRAQVLQAMIQSGAKRYDFLGGADSYKLKFGVRCGSYVSLSFAPTLRGRLWLSARHRKQQFKAAIKRMLPAAALAALGREASGSRKKQIPGSPE